MEELAKIKFEKFKKSLWQGWKEELFWLILMSLLIYTSWAYKKDMEICQEIIRTPCEYCFAYEQQQNIYKKVNLTNFFLPNFTVVNTSEEIGSHDNDT